MRRVLGRIAIVVTVLVSGFVVVAPVASAATNGYFLASNVNIRSCPYTSCTSHGQGQYGQNIAVNCWAPGTPVSGVVTWVRGRNLSTGVYGYAAAIYVQSLGNGTPGSGDRWQYYVPRC